MFLGFLSPRLVDFVPVLPVAVVVVQKEGKNSEWKKNSTRNDMRGGEEEAKKISKSKKEEIN